MTLENPTPATWIFKRPDYQGGFIREEVPVFVIGETAKSYKIKLQTGKTKLVRRYNVKFKNKPIEVKIPIQTWLPYKD